LHGAEHYAAFDAEAPMLFGFINRISSANRLKENLDLSAQRTRGIAQRVAGATLQNQAGFAMPNGEIVSKPEAVNLEAEMTSLADEQLRYEATEKLLEKAYQQIRVSMRDR
jgi:flagellar basal body rod protein FlgB